MKVAITSPSLDATQNISGIANHTRLVILENAQIDYTHICIGKKDNQKRNLYWLASQIGTISTFFKRTKKVELVHLNVPLANLSIAINILLVALAKLRKKKLVIHFRGGALGYKKEHNIYQQFAMSIFFRYSDALIFLGYAEKKSFFEKYTARDNCKSYVLPNAVRVSKLDEVRALEKFSNKRLELVYFGRMDKAKGLEEMSIALEAVSKKIIDFHFHVVGDGPDLKYFEADLQSRCLSEHFTLHGSKTQDEILAILETCHLFILPSHFEGLPNALLESMANYVVPVVTPVGSISEVVSSGYNGFLIPLMSPFEMAETICAAAANRKLLMNMAARCHSLMDQSYSIRAYCLSLQEIYAEVLSSD